MRTQVTETECVAIRCCARDPANANRSRGATHILDDDWLIEGLASEKVGDHNNARESLARAKELLSSLQQKWGAGIYSSYTNRPDIEAYRKQLDASIVAIH